MLRNKIQDIGRFLSAMVMPNISAFIALGFITVLFIPSGWFPNEALASIAPLIRQYLLPILIGYTGAKLVAGERGALVGAVTTVGIIIGSDMPTLIGAMIVGPLGGGTIKKVDVMIAGKIKPGFEMLVNNMSSGIVAMLCAIIAFIIVSPAVEAFSLVLTSGVAKLVELGLLPFVSILIEPAKVLFLNNVINHGIFTPLGMQEVEHAGRSILFLIEANPGPGLGILLACMLFGKGTIKKQQRARRSFISSGAFTKYISLIY